MGVNFGGPHMMLLVASGTGQGVSPPQRPCLDPAPIEYAVATGPVGKEGIDDLAAQHYPLSNKKLRELAAKHKPPHEWYREEGKPF